MNDRAPPPPEPAHTADMNTLLGIIRHMVGEVHPKWKHVLFTPDTLLERELGLDSLARMELLLRINETLGISLDERTAACAATPDDLMQAIRVQTQTSEGDPSSQAGPDAPWTTDADDLLMGDFQDPCGADTVPAQTRRTLHEWFYALYTWPVFIIFGIVSWIVVVLTPFSSWRSKLAHIIARLFFIATFTPLRVSGHEHLATDKAQVLVANHASYLDGFIVTAALDIPIHFIVKGELARILPIRMILHRFGVEFVDRFNAHSGAHSVRRITDKSRQGQTLVFFPEGTFTSFAGLQPFRMGAFVTAARTGAPLVPVAIRGARDMVRGHDWFPRQGQIEVTIRPPLMPAEEGWQAALQLRDAARREISQWCGEPDLLEIYAEPDDETPG